VGFQLYRYTPWKISDIYIHWYTQESLTGQGFHAENYPEDKKKERKKEGIL
jgi:hypothetical protein